MFLSSRLRRDFFFVQFDEPLIELRDLEPSESYNISATIVSSNLDAYHLDTQIFTTLKSDYQPENLTEMWVEEFEPVEGDGTRLSAVVGWNPARGEHQSR